MGITKRFLKNQIFGHHWWPPIKQRISNMKIVINRSAMGQARFLLCTRLFFYWRADTDLHSAKSCSGLWITQPVIFIRQKLLKHYYRENVTDNVSFNACKIHFFAFIEVLDLKRILNTLRIEGMCWLCSFHFRYVTNKIVYLKDLKDPLVTFN